MIYIDNLFVITPKGKNGKTDAARQPIRKHNLL